MTIAIIRVRGVKGLKYGIAQAIVQMHLTRKNHCIVIDGNLPWVNNVLSKVKDYVTWGELDAVSLKALQEKRKPEASWEKGGVKFCLYRLNNPTGGWKGGIKNAFPQGNLGKRGDKIGELIVRMLH